MTPLVWVGLASLPSLVVTFVLGALWGARRQAAAEFDRSYKRQRGPVLRRADAPQYRNGRRVVS